MIKTIIAVCMLSTCSTLNAHLITPKEIEGFAKDTTAGIKALLDVKTINPEGISMEEASKYFRSFEKFCEAAIKDGQKDYLSYLAAYPLRETAFETIIKVQLNNLYFDEIIKSEDFKNRVKQAREKREEENEGERKNNQTEITFKDGKFSWKGQSIDKDLIAAVLNQGNYGGVTFDNISGMRSLFKDFTGEQIIASAPASFLPLPANLVNLPLPPNFGSPPGNLQPPPPLVPQTGGGSNNRANLMAELEKQNPMARLRKTETVEKGGVNKDNEVTKWLKDNEGITKGDIVKVDDDFTFYPGAENEKKFTQQKLLAVINSFDPRKKLEWDAKLFILSFQQALKAKIASRFQELHADKDDESDEEVVEQPKKEVKEEPKITEPKKEEIIKIEIRPEEEGVRESLQKMMDSLLNFARDTLEKQGYFSMEDLESLFNADDEKEDKRELSQKEKNYIDERLYTVFQSAIEQTRKKENYSGTMKSKIELISIKSETEISNITLSINNPDSGDSMKKINNGISNLTTANKILKEKLDFICSACDAVMKHEEKDTNLKPTDLTTCKQVIKNLLETMKKNIEFANNLLPAQCLNKNKAFFDKLYKTEGAGINTQYQIKEEEITIGEFKVKTKTIADNIENIYSYKDFYNEKIKDPIAKDLGLEKIN